MLSSTSCEGRRRAGRDRHGRRRLHRHAGPPDGQAAPRASSSSRRSAAEHPVEGCNYLLALDMEMDPVPGYEIASWEQGYGDFAIAPDLGDAAADPVARGDGARALRRRSGTTARRSSPRRARC